MAAGGFATSLRDGVRGYSNPNFLWNNILKSDLANDSIDKHCSAEFLLWISPENAQLDTDQYSASIGLPLDLISCVYHHPQIDFETLRFCDYPTAEYTHAKTNHFLFTYDNELNNNALTVRDTTAVEICENLELLSAKMPFTLSSKFFLNKSNAVSYIHGCPHVAKVMFWVGFLTHPKNLAKLNLVCSDANKYLAEDTMLAALLHDLRRENDQEETKHGLDAVEFYSKHIWNFVGSDKCRYARIVQAVEYHCKPDEVVPDNFNPVWLLLKDADALDRGRFGVPCDGDDYKRSNCANNNCLGKHSGCAHKTLRLDYSQLGGTSKIAWAAWNLTQSTKNAAWSDERSVTYLSHHIKTCIKLYSL